MSAPQSEDRTRELLLLGEIHGMVKALKDGQDIQTKRLDGMDERLRVVEQRSAVIGATAGGVTAVGMALIVEAMRAWMGRGGH